MKITRKNALDYTRGVLRGHPGVRIQSGVRLTGPGTYDLHRGSIIMRGARIYVGPGAVLTLAKGSKIGERSIVNVATGVSIGPGSELSWDVQVMDTDFHTLYRADGTAHDHTRAVTLGAHVLVGTASLILKGVHVGDGAVVGAGSVVRSSVPPHAVVAGNPAQVVGQISDWGHAR